MTPPGAIPAAPDAGGYCSRITLDDAEPVPSVLTPDRGSTDLLAVTPPDPVTLLAPPRVTEPSLPLSVLPRMAPPPPPSNWP